MVFFLKKKKEYIYHSMISRKSRDFNSNYNNNNNVF